MFSLQQDVIQSPWESPLDANYASLWGEESVLALLWSDMSQYNPYSSELDVILDELDTKLKSLKRDFTDGDVAEAYQNLYYFTQIQANINNFIPNLQHKYDKLKIMDEIYSTYKKDSLEKTMNETVITNHNKRQTEQKELRDLYTDKKGLSTSEMKFISSQMSNIDSKYDSQISMCSGMRATNAIATELKKDPYSNELKRKLLILDSSITYIEKLFKVCQEQVNTHKKVIENLMFLYNQSK